MLARSKRSSKKDIWIMDILKAKLDAKNYSKLIGINNSHLHRFIARFVEHCRPDKVFVCTDSEEDMAFIREEAVRRGEEKGLAIKGHTIHFDGYNDQGRDPRSTRFLLPPGMDLGPDINAIDKQTGEKEILSLLKGIMQGGSLYIQFFCLGPVNSEFSISAVQLTDSSYVAHSQNLLYRLGYEEFKKIGDSPYFFRFVHSAGELEGGVSKNIDQRRIYIDIESDTIYSVNTQYGGNTIGHKKLAMRLAIKRASEEHWLTEHMFLMGVKGPQARVTYFSGAFPSLCGKTATSMLKGERIVGDDIVYIRAKQGEMRAVNVEKGIFGIIQGVNFKDDPIIWKALENPGEVIVSNVLLTDEGRAWWIGKDGKVPQKGFNHSGHWHPGKKDAQGNEITCSHPNARFTLDMKLLENLDPAVNNPEGVVVKGIIYGGRDSDTWVPVEQSFDWLHGVITKGASLESETTAAALGKEGVRKFDPMANLSFLSITVGKYIRNYLDFGAKLTVPPVIFSVNYFLKDAQGNFLNDKLDKAVWLKWMERRVHNEMEAVEMPTGFIPKYEDLKKLFKAVLKRDYPEGDYIKQFTLRVPENLAKIERITGIYKTKVSDAPPILFQVLGDQKKRLEKAREKYGDYISPESWQV